ncbi:MAG: hypothetical protein JJU06_11445 [Ectothiorhodospiraceae bacterium]|nr:hypothetical protein [Ectothiorhodospiraceae bacterium]
MPVFNIENPSSRAQRGRNNRARGAHLRRLPEKEVFVMTPGELVELWKERQRRKGLTDEEIAENFRAVTTYMLDSIPGAASPVRDSTVLTRLARDLRRGGSVLTTYRVIRRGNSTLIALRGYAGLRHHLPASLYGAQHPTIIRMAVGPAGQRAMASGGIIVTAVVSPAVRTFQWIFDDEVTWRHMLVNVSMDMAKAVAAAGAFVAGTHLGVGLTPLLGLAATPIIVPIIAGAVAAVLVGAGLSYLDRKFGVTDMLVAALDEALVELQESVRRSRRSVNYFLGTPQGQMEFIQRFSGMR